MSKKDVTKVVLDESDIPKQWYNILADMPNKPAPYFSSKTGKPVTLDELQAIFPMELIQQENSQERWIDIPEEVREMYRQWRPSPLYRARALEKHLGTPARIYYKYEGTNATGSHKLNTSLPQAYYNKIAGIKRLSTETGAGQWGSALSLACNHFGLECTVYMVKVSYEQKPYRRSFMKTFGAQVYASPTNLTSSGRAILEKDPDCTGSLGIAISEAVEDAATHDDTNYALGSVLNHVCLHQTIIGLEAKKQLEYLDEYPDVVFACCGGGSNFAGIAFPFLMDKFKGTKVRAVAVEPTACPTLTKGVYAYDYSDTGKIGPLAKMYTVGHDFVPAGIHAGGLRYHGVSPIVSQLYEDKLIEAKAYGQSSVFEAAVIFARTEGIVPAPESSHAIRAAIDEALLCKESGEAKVILFNLSGHGYFDMAAYDNYFSGKLSDVDYSEEEIARSMKNLPKVD
ncbi:MAG TPA: TrpB-like pyridoxal phosphate-dependent enzyme [Hungateiclostridium thermocellum]|jgi:tryptophan synthase beta chain|uniref:Tryptophan synthase beta chain n=2 Tax=Acetivibrio thermocellus TaxID=1515 RepID=A3DER4_ACET2|nr:TrpB-like pyridoxal phosphate-dependent enzyme [Acetivibrio thermocellus]CDG35882.1 Tryptophan synthase beta chain 2 [Acetivibrio thermocellus BC1]ABN52443.1 pyridoxal-phosphate dependent TrpB-like enzyme [Acetivibrio thermocellus ATCC 27405]ADU74114.1 pyridoxal-phosphate dependent TrpB-like enzyme [Acetivibrio thermocellus DSM 1313]ALX08052.1 Tryptophan synthase beta chain [Acetivibrio thermocellus AD2]ANV75799.1 Tryptophan synthase beta chain [Acetivibrio thermocellus DSM 2360]